MVSVIIPTYNGAYKLPIIINSILSETILPNEVIIVVDGSTDNTKEILEELKLPSNFQILYRKNGGRAAVRNSGANFATGDLLIFFDDDMLPAPDCVEKHLEHHSQHPGSILSGAQIDYITQASTDFQKFKSHLTTKWADQIRGNEQSILLRDNIFMTAANCSFSKKVFEKLGGFDERLTDAEDFDLAIRANQLHIPIYYDHSVFAWHNDPVTCKKYISRTKQYTMAQSKLRELKPDQMLGITKYQKANLGWFKKSIFRSLASDFWVDSIDHSLFLRMLPRTIRYKLYDLVVTANGVYSDRTAEVEALSSSKVRG